MKIKFKDETIIECNSVSNSLEYVRGASRNCIAFSFNADEVSNDRLLEFPIVLKV